MGIPFFRLRVDVYGNFPTRQPDSGRRRDGVEERTFVRHVGETVVRTCFPIPVRCRLVKRAEALFAVVKGQLGSLAVFDIGINSVPPYYSAGIDSKRLCCKLKPAVLTV